MVSNNAKGQHSLIDYACRSSYAIAKVLDYRDATWADFVVLHVIYQKKLFNSKTTMEKFEQKYPGADFGSYSLPKNHGVAHQRSPTKPADQSSSFAVHGVIDADAISSNKNELTFFQNPYIPRDSRETQALPRSINSSDDDARPPSIKLLNNTIGASERTPESVALPERTMRSWGRECDSPQTEAGLLARSPLTDNLKRSRSPSIQLQSSPKRTRTSLSCAQIESSFEKSNDTLIQLGIRVADLEKFVADQAVQMGSLQTQNRKMQDLLNDFFK